MKNIRSYVDEKIEFPLGSTLLSGDIGSGKSSVLLAIDFALFGIHRGLSGSDLLRHGSNSGFVELEFEIDGKDITIRRSLRRDKDGVKQDSGFIDINGSREDLMPTEIRARIIELLGYSHEYKTKYPIIFHYTVYTPQDEMKRILINPEERLNTIRKIFGIDKYGRIKENTKIILTEFRAMKRELLLQVMDLEEKIKELDAKIDERKNVEIELTKNLSSLDEIEKKLVKKKKELDAVSHEISEFNRLKEVLARKQTERKMKKERIEKIEVELKDVEEKMKNMEKEISVEIQKPDKSLNEVNSMIEFLDAQRNILISDYAITNDLIKTLQEIYEKGVCGVCNQIVADPESFRNNIDNKKTYMKELSERIQNVNKEMAELKAMQNKIIEYNSAIERKEVLKKNYKDISIRKLGLDEEKQILESDIINIDSDIADLNEKILNYGNLEEKSNELSAELEEIQKAKNDLTKIVSRLEQNMINIDGYINSLRKDIDEKKKIKEKIMRIDEIVDWLSSNFMILMDIIEKYVLSAIQSEFNKFFQEWFSILIGEGLSVKIDETFSPIIEQDGYQTEYENLSGGEKTSVALSYRLALNKVINSLSEIKTKDLIILDEPTDGFSTEQLDRVRDVLNELNLTQTIIVSHEPKIDTYVDNVIKFYKEENVSKVVI